MFKNKKILISALALVLVFAISSCADEKQNEQESKKQTETESNKTETENKSENETENKNTEAGVLNIYSSRHYDVDKVVYENFEKATGIKINLVEGKSGELLERIKTEKDSPQADLFLTVGAESIYTLKNENLIEEYSSDVLNENIPAEYIGKGWNGVMARARIIAYPKETFDPSQIKTYDDLKDEKYKGKILVRSSSSSYNQALLASFIELNGLESAKSWAEGIVANMAREPKGNDRDQAKAVVAGEGELAIMNSYYFVRMSRSSDPAEVEVSEKLGLLFPEDTHINLSFSAILNGAKNKENAVKFIEFVTSVETQELYAKENGEFPLNKKVELPEIQKSWGEFTPQKLDFENFGKNRLDAVKIFDESKWK